jgi:hypothetical protein
MRVLAGFVICLLGAFIGLTVWVIAMVAQGEAFTAGIILPQLIQNPTIYWPLPALGAIVAGLSFLAAEILRRAN